MNDPTVSVALRLMVAKLAAPFRHKKIGEGSKAETSKSAAEAERAASTHTGVAGAAVKH